MKIIIKWICCIVLSLLLVSVIFIISNIVISKNISYPKWVKDYLQNRYSENMIITNTYISDIGYCAVVFPETEPNLKFSVRGKYIDTYLESALEYQAEQELKRIYPEYTCVAQMFGYESITTPFAELYTLYKTYNRPANWNEIPKYIRLERFRVNTNQNIDDSSINVIVSKIALSEFRTSIIEILDNNKLYTYKYDESINTFIFQGDS